MSQTCLPLLCLGIQRLSPRLCEPRLRHLIISSISAGFERRNDALAYQTSCTSHVRSLAVPSSFALWIGLCFPPGVPFQRAREDRKDGALRAPVKLASAEYFPDLHLLLNEHVCEHQLAWARN